jgi:peptidoglycan/xylan/chitin deacetylase (PgdA/CDA1 family)
MTLRTRLRDLRLLRRAVVPVLAALQPADRLADWIAFPMYHHFRPGDEAAFRTQLRGMRDLGDFIGLDDAVALLAGGGLRGRHFCLTFDDGWHGPYAHARAILAEAEIPTAFFVVPGWIDRGAGLQDGRDEKVITWAECRVLADAGMTIGSHSVDHARLAALDAYAARGQLEGSRARIEGELGRACRHFAAPWGQPGADYIGDRDPGLAREAGYHSFLTTIRGRATVATSPFAIPRLRLEPEWGIGELRYALGR